MILAGLTLAAIILMALVDVSIVLLGLIYLTQIATRLGTMGLKIAFWTNLSLLVLFLLLSACSWRGGGMGYTVSVVICFATSLCVTGAAGTAILPSPWRYPPLLLVLIGAMVFMVWFRIFRPLIK